MEVERFIQMAIDKGYESGARALDPLQRMIFLVSELWVCCDKDGIDSFLDVYGAFEVRAVADLLRDSGAIAIADTLAQLADALPHRDEALLNSANDLVTSREGFEYDAFASIVADRIQKPLLTF